MSRIHRSHTFLNIDGRTYRARRWKKLRAQFVDEIGLEYERLSETTKLRLNTLTDVALALEIERDKQVSGDVVDSAVLNKLSRTFIRLTQQLGLEDQ